MHDIMQATLGVEAIVASTSVTDKKQPFFQRCLPQNGVSTAGFIFLMLRFCSLSQQRGGLCLSILSFSIYKVASSKGTVLHKCCQCQNFVCAGIDTAHQPAARDFLRCVCTVSATTVGAQLHVLVGAVTGFHWPTPFNVLMNI